MSGLTARVQMVSNALILLGDSPLSSLTDERTGAVLGSNLFEGTYLSMLTTHRWRFASKTFQLNRLSAAPTTEWQYAFQLPTDMLYLFYSDTERYQIYGNELHSDSLEIRVEYICRIDEDKLPPYFIKALEYNLAHQFALPLTGDLGKGDYYMKMFNNEVRKAKFADSTQHPQDEIRNKPYVDTRY